MGRAGGLDTRLSTAYNGNKTAVKQVNRLKRQGEKASEPPATKECPFCVPKIPFQATRCPFCTSELAAAVA